MRAAKLRRLLTANSDEEKVVIKAITSCIKFMHQNYDIEAYRMHRLYQTILKEFGCVSRKALAPTHVPEDVLIRVASNVLKINQLMNTRLYDKMRQCLISTSQDAQVNEPQMLVVSNLKLLVELYQFLPGKKTNNSQSSAFNFAEGMGRGRNNTATRYNTIQGGTPLEAL